MSPCHPSHQPAKPDPRAVKRQHKWRHGHDPRDPDADPASGWIYANIELEAGPTAPDQRHLLKGGPPSGFDCLTCGEETRITGEMSQWEIYQQPEVKVVNLQDIDEARRKVLEETMIVSLSCPKCGRHYQFAEDMLATLKRHGES